MMIYLSKSKKLHRCIMLIDASVGLQENDKMLIDLLTEMQKPFILVMTKSDKLGKEGGKEELESKIDNVKVFI